MSTTLLRADERTACADLLKHYQAYSCGTSIAFKAVEQISEDDVSGEVETVGSV